MNILNICDAEEEFADTDDRRSGESSCSQHDAYSTRESFSKCRVERNVASVLDGLRTVVVCLPQPTSGTMNCFERKEKLSIQRGCISAHAVFVNTIN